MARKELGRTRVIERARYYCLGERLSNLDWNDIRVGTSCGPVQPIMEAGVMKKDLIVSISYSSIGIHDFINS